MTYARFLGLFVVLPILFLVVRYRRTLSWRGLAPMGVLLVVVYAATSPWDNMAVKWGLWGFDPERIWGVKLGYLPLEEYLFFGLQTLLVGLWARARLERALAKQPEARPAEKARPVRAEPPLGSREVSS
ncbi:lycopene cyclase domain-containing protein [Corallococcus sp. ZKHCc1 1396]|uniref:Lycopene cyclase domain-containing protein n=1 Tax=Corallococcus soli TaxID=2710757 RepID=A0ABR9PGZ8_9BACT|nr:MULTISPECIES: lycopene cyclase domain-containing protein [Corallococcus]MBE4747196.1 lycopene cyclase domain-containing protein [Corallococcus soli]MCY1036533.1 lycopene cyclase domain-containing protein [Corallococcus sp. BB11-1]